MPPIYEFHFRGPMPVEKTYPVAIGEAEHKLLNEMVIKIQSRMGVKTTLRSLTTLAIHDLYKKVMAEPT